MLRVAPEESFPRLHKILDELMLNTACPGLWVASWGKKGLLLVMARHRRDQSLPRERWVSRWVFGNDRRIVEEPECVSLSLPRALRALLWMKTGLTTQKCYLARAADAYKLLNLWEMVRPERFELPAFWFVARRSIQLS